MNSKGWSRLGPGLMLAAAAVGVSHLVQATRAGADYGFSFLWLIILISLLKYPAFRFAIDYASLTNRNLVHAYSAIGRLALTWLFLALLVDIFVATGAVALVTAGLFISVFDLPFTGPQVAIALCVITGAILINGRYAKTEGIVKVFVLLFSVFVVISTLIALPELGSQGRDLFASIEPSLSLAVFVVAMTGWMPLPLTGAIFLSMWAEEKSSESGDERFEHENAVSDFHFGWILTVVLALCFAVLGTAILFQTGRMAPTNAGAFASEFLSIFTSVVGDWAYPLIAIAAIAVMWSGVFALMDAVPRVTARLYDQALGHEDESKWGYTAFLGVQILGVTLILLFFMQSFATFIDFATGLGFVSAPALAYYNYRAIKLREVAEHYQPASWLLAWHWIGLVALALFALAFLYLRFA